MRLPHISTSMLVKAFLRMGFEELSRKNSHIKIVDPNDATRYAAIPNHKGIDLSVGSLRNILKSTRVEVKDLLKYV